MGPTRPGVVKRRLQVTLATAIAIWVCAAITCRWWPLLSFLLSMAAAVALALVPLQPRDLELEDVAPAKARVWRWRRRR